MTYSRTAHVLSPNSLVSSATLAPSSPLVDSPSILSLKHTHALSLSHTQTHSILSLFIFVSWSVFGVNNGGGVWGSYGIGD